MIEFIAYFGKFLAEILNISAPAARGLLKLSIMEEFGPYKQLTQVTLYDFKKVLLGALKLRLIKLEVQNCDEIVEIMLIKLRENQSLITMGGV